MYRQFNGHFVWIFMTIIIVSEVLVEGQNMSVPSTVQSITSLNSPSSQYIRMDQPLNNITAFIGGRAQFHCKASGNPQPEFSWNKNNQLLIQSTGSFVIKEYDWGSRLTLKNIDIIDEGTIQCTARNDAGIEKSVALLSVDPNIVTEEEVASTEARCESYQGDVCVLQFIQTTVFMKANTIQQEIERNLQEAFGKINDLSMVSSSCRQKIMHAMCLDAFPLCTQQASNKYTVHKLCFNDCMQLERDICSNLYVYADEQHDDILSVMLPVCSELPFSGSVQGNLCQPVLTNVTNEWRPPIDEKYIHTVHNMENTTLNANDKATMKCAIQGNPQPYYQWYKNDAPIEPQTGKRIKIQKFEWGSRLTIKNVETTDIGYYRCDATNSVGKRSVTGILYVKIAPHRPEEGKPDYGMCQVYNGAMCSKILTNRTVFIGGGHTLTDIDSSLTAAFSFLFRSKDLSPDCSNHVIPSLCHYTFPYCDENGQPREICRDECEMLEKVTCRQEYAIAQSELIPQCKLLPVAGSKESANCIRIGIPHVKVIRNDTCYNNSGENYLGRMNITKSGLVCAPWNTNLQVPRLSPGKYPELAGGHNYCRNPGRQLAGPWCYPVNKNYQELCDVPKCFVLPYTGSTSESHILYILIPAIALILLIVICMCICFCMRQSRLLQTDHNAVEAVAMQQKPSVHEFPRAAVKFHEVLGQGTFGNVFRGDLIGYEHQYSVTPVALKTLKPNTTPKMQEDFYHEAEVMASLKHPNIISLLGVVMRGQPMSMVFEYVNQGDLREFLSRHSPNSDVGFGSADDDTLSSLDQADFLKMAIQISAGMDYLSNLRFVHRDLATRNCLVGDNLTIKIADFGLSRDIYSTDYYHMQGQVLLPIRWMSPEAILYGRFSTESDVWAFGVVLWEVYNYGLQPFFGYTNQEVIEMVRTRHILPCPSGCPPHVYALMTECWQEVPIRRPSFKAIYTKLRSWDGMPTANHNGTHLYTTENDISTAPLLGPASPIQSHHSSSSKSHCSAYKPQPMKVTLNNEKAMSESSVASSSKTRSTGTAKVDPTEQTDV
ncbi:inactive tyrosine-protein kinase transmembrane receptor ROR1-like [Antedon mediterranea]|uniref:inactive tyrosine-protein kinase transmembrane receptor ROR1-like n=1 Tax=Antedon mediterranea TaxID=105859 RepID=UPI003AF509AB